MQIKRIGQQTFHFTDPPRLVGAKTIVGPKEGNGPLGEYFDEIVQDPLWGEKTPEKAERKFLEQASTAVLAENQYSEDDMDLFISGDILNQIISATFTARTLGIPYIGIFGACASIAEGMGLGAMLIDGGFASRLLVATSSHYQTAERQYRYPIELNMQRKSTNAWTVTGAAAAILSANESGARVTSVTVGRVMDYGLKDPNDMGAAMAPAANDTLMRHFQDTSTTPGDYDLILTGDLGSFGSKMLRTLAGKSGITLGEKHQDAGCLIFSPQQQTGVGGSGCACSATVFLGYVLKEMMRGRFKRVLLVATGALFNPLTWQQGETIPCIAHALVLETG